jgi:hypothetical protein
MATLTAHVLIGGAHPNHDGILPTHALFLSENSRPALVLTPLDVWGDRQSRPDEPPPRRVVWIPHPEHIVDDLILQVAVHVVRESGVIAQAESIVDDIVSADHLELGDLTEADRKTLFTACRAVESFPKLVVMILSGSTLARNAPRFGDYSMDIEVCSVAYLRRYSPWTEKTHIAGELSGIGDL